MIEGPFRSHEVDTNAPCADCGAVWVSVPEVGFGALEMIHETDCAWWNALVNEA